MSDPEAPPVVDQPSGAGEVEVGDPGLRRRFRRPSRLQIASVALVTLLALGPLVAMVIVVRADDGAIDELVTGPAAAEGGARVVATITSVAPAAGELRARVLVVPRDELLDATGRPLVDLVARSNDIRGQTTYEFPAGQPLRPVEVVVALGGGSITRYPFDAYTSRLAIALTAAAEDEEPESVPVVLDVRSSVNDLSVSMAPTVPDDSSALRLADLEVERRASTTAYAVWIMVLMWSMAVAGVLIVWAVTIWGAEPPMWSYAYFLGVLFALPQLRSQLPGSPPPGTLLDFVAFYWSIAIVGVSLIISLGIWVRSNRPAG
jgi:hypothetical protein